MTWLVPVLMVWVAFLLFAHAVGALDDHPNHAHRIEQEEDHS